MSQLIVPDHFGIIEDGVYRSECFSPIHFPFLRALRLRTIISLTPEMPTKQLLHFFEETKIQFLHLGLKSWRPSSGWRPMSEELIKDGMEILLDATYHPLMIMDSSGVHETGIFVGCLRKLQRWNFSSILVEYRSFAGSRARYINEQFIELFDVDLISLPRTLPSWFSEQLELDDKELEAREAEAGDDGDDDDDKDDNEG